MINNEGELVFDYNLEDTDTYAGGVVFNGQESILWNNIRDAFGADIKSMYNTLRSAPNTKLCYQYVKNAFETHQDVWPIALWNEDAYVKYLSPYLSNGTDNLAMLQGSKASQRDWWLYNGFKYRDSKYESGDANNYIQMRAFQKDSITVTTYSHVYAKAEFGNERIAMQRATRNTPVTLTDPSSDPWATGTDTVVRIYSADRIASLGDLSGLNAGTADFSNAIKLQSLKLGSTASGYENTHLTSLTIGNNELLTELDISNCSNMSQTVDLTGCVALETVKAAGTIIQGINLPNGGHLKYLTLPSTMANLTILNQKQFTTLTMPSYTNVTTLNIENTPNVPIEAILTNCQTGSRIRLININWSVTNETSLQNLVTKLDSCVGLNADGSNAENPIITGRLSIDSISAELFDTVTTKYPELVIVINNVPQYMIIFKNYNNTILYKEIVGACGNAVNPVTAGYISTPTGSNTDTVHSVFSGWSSLPTNVQSNQTVIAQYTESYRVRFYSDIDLTTLLYTIYVSKGNNATYSGSTPTKDPTAQASYTFYGWYGTLTNITEPTDTYAVYTRSVRQYTITFKNEDNTILQSGLWDYDSTPTYSGTTPPQHSGTAADWEWIGWNPSITSVTGNATYTASYRSLTIPEIGNNWNRSNVSKNQITSIVFTPDYTPEEEPDETWDASYRQTGNLIGYRFGTDIVITWDGNTSATIVLNTNCYQMFYFYKKITSLDLSNFNTSKVTDMRNMFSNCESLTSITFGENFDTSNVTNMYRMFAVCESLTSTNINNYLSNFNTSKVTDMSAMFVACSALTTLNLSSFNTSNVTNMSSMFGGCEALTSITFGENFDTSNVTDMSGMFNSCESLTSTNINNYLSNFDTNKVTNMSSMFGGCSALTSLDLSKFNTSNVTNMCYMFNMCKALTSITFGENFDTSNVAKMNDMFSVCYALTTLDISSFDTSKVTDMRNMFSNCKALTSITFGENFDTSNVTDMNTMFYNCESLTTLNLSNFDTSKVTDMSKMFGVCSALTTLNLSSFNTSNVTNMCYMFYNCESLTTLNLSNFDTSKVTYMDYMFYNCKSLTSLDLSSFNTSNVISMSSMFNGCKALTTLDLSSFNTSNVTYMSGMFYNCKSLTSLDLSSFNTSNVISMSSMFNGCKALTTLDLSSFNTSNVTYMSGMFCGCSALTSLNLSNFDTSKVTDMSIMFGSCYALTSLDLSNFDTSSVLNMSGMFNYCNGLTWLNISKFNTSCVTNMNAMFYEAIVLTVLIIGQSTDNNPQPLIISNAFSSHTPTIYVPDALVDAYKSATNWSQYASSIVGQSTLSAA